MAWNRETLEAEVRRLAPWHHDLELPHGVRTHVPDLSRREIERTRLPNLIRHLWPRLLERCGGDLKGLRVLDVACNAGGFSIEAARAGAEHVLGFDTMEHYIDQANLLKEVLEIDNVEFRKMAADEVSVHGIGEFDVTFVFGILYHLEDPIRVMKQLSSVTRRIMVVDTRIHVPNRLVRWWVTSRPYWLLRFPSAVQADTPGASTALWRAEEVAQLIPTGQAVEDLLRFLGFSRVERLKPVEKGLEKRYYRGNRVTFLAERGVSDS